MWIVELGKKLYSPGRIQEITGYPITVINDTLDEYYSDIWESGT